MIAALFTLSGMLLFMLAVALHDGIISISERARQFDEDFGEDWKIYPDYEP